MKWLRRHLRRLGSPSTVHLHGRWIGVPPPRSGRALPTVTPWSLPGDWLSNDRWVPPVEWQKALAAVPKSFERSLGSTSVSGNSEKGLGLQVPGALLHALQSGFVDAVAVDHACLPFAGLDRVLATPANMIHEFDTILRQHGLAIKMQLTAAANTYAIDHAVSQVHSINDCHFCLDHAHIPGHFSAPWLTVLNVAREEFTRYIRGECSLTHALKQFLIRAGAKTGIALLLKKICVVVASWFWSTTAALILGPIGLFAGLLVGTELGESLRRFALDTAYNALRARENHMKLSLEEHLTKANRDAEQLRQDFLDNYKGIREQQRNLTAAALIRQKTREDTVLTDFVKVYSVELTRIQVKQSRSRQRLRSGYSPNAFHRIHRGPTTWCTEDFERQFAEADVRLRRGWQALAEPDLRRRIAAVTRWLTEVNMHSPRLDRAVKTLHVSLQCLEAQRLATRERFIGRQTTLARACVGRFERHRYNLGDVLEKTVVKEIRKTDESIDDVLAEARKIGEPITIVRPWATV